MKRLKEIKMQLSQMSEREAMRMWRLARNAQKRGCSRETVNKIREEADWLYRSGTVYPGSLLDWEFEKNFKYAFR